MGGSARERTGRKGAATELPYPPSPASVPPELLRLAPGYAARALVLLVGLLLFVALYVGLGIALAFLVAELWTLPVSGRGGAYLVIGGTLALAVPILFLAKGIFYREHHRMDGLVEITRDEQPRLFAFLDRLVKETGAPAPRRVYVAPEVNAAVFYEPSILSLVLPTPKSLLIGLGLVNHLTVSELKAVLGHELGHFSQRAMKLGSYVYVAGRVVGNLVYGRDWFDDLLESGKRSDARIAIVAYLASGVVGGIRMVLKAAFKLLTLGERSLGREMEFAADRAAVAVAGGDAIGRGLYKAEVADACYLATLQRLTHAADQGLVTDDFFVHQARALDDVRLRLKKPGLGDPTVRTDGYLFAADALSQPSMWATHPPSAERERAARATGVTADHDERPAWELFEEPAKLRQRLTTELVRLRLPHAKAFPKPAAEIEAHFDRERKTEARLHRYGEMYAGRPLAKLDLDALFARTPRDEAALRAAADALYGRRVEQLSEKWRRAQDELQLLVRAQRGELRPEALRLGGVAFSPGDASRLAEERVAQMKAIDRDFEAEDRRVAEVHAEIAILRGEEAKKRLRRRYAECFRLARWTQSIQEQRADTMRWVGPLLQRSELDASALSQITDSMGELDAAVARVLAQARDRKPPPLPNVKKSSTMATFLLERPTVGPYENGMHLGGWMQAILGQSAEVLDKLDRLHRLAVSRLLQEHERLRRQLDEQPEPETEVDEDEA